MSKKKSFIIVICIIVIQLGFLLYQTIGNELKMKTGQEIILQLQPVDPRSLIQGDYVILNYNISSLSLKEKYGTVQIVLKKDNTGVYRFKRVHNKFVPLDNTEVVITGKIKGDNIFYGIESYFVPEGTSIEVEGKARYAVVRISKKGDAMVTHLLSNPADKIIP